MENYFCIGEKSISSSPLLGVYSSSLRMTLSFVTYVTREKIPRRVAIGIGEKRARKRARRRGKRAP